eukprot:scaffold10553_cov124-Isochrysis_galbana.AAC.1
MRRARSNSSPLAEGNPPPSLNAYQARLSPLATLDEEAVGECLVGRHVPGVAVDRCASFGVVRAGSVLLPGLSVVDRWV